MVDVLVRLTDNLKTSTLILMGNKIIDEHTDLKASRQYKWKLRHPKQAKAINARYEASESRKKAKRDWAKRTKQ